MTSKKLVKRAWRHLRAALAPGPRPAILMYHRVGAETFDPWGLAVTPARFAAQLEWLSQRRQVLDLAEFVRRHLDGCLPDDAVALTFDDGYASTLSAGLPALQLHDLHATIFLPVELIESGDEFWWDTLESILIGDRVQDRSWSPMTPPRTSQQKKFLRLWSEFRTKPASEIQASLTSLRNVADGPPPRRESHRLLRVDEIRAAPSANIAFGSHGMTHASLPALDTDAIVREVAESAERCTGLTGQRPMAFAYPFGDYDWRSEDAVGLADYLCACATTDAAVSPRSSRFALPRLQVGNWNPSELALRLAAL